MADIGRRLLAVPAAFRALGQFLWFVGQSNDPYRLIYYAKEGDMERAFETVEMSDEEIHDTLTEIRDNAIIVGEEVPEIREVDQEDFVNE